MERGCRGDVVLRSRLPLKASGALLKSAENNTPSGEMPRLPSADLIVARVAAFLP